MARVQRTPRKRGDFVVRADLILFFEFAMPAAMGSDSHGCD